MTRRIIIIIGIILFSVLITGLFFIVFPNSFSRLPWIRGGSPDASQELHKELKSISSSLRSPIRPGGSLDNLIHYLDKDPGRSRFPGFRDRARMKTYRTPEIQKRAAERGAEFALNGLLDGRPPWAEDFAGTVGALFDVLILEIGNLVEFPAQFSEGFNGIGGIPSANERLVRALTDFGDTWASQDAVLRDYQSDSVQVSRHLAGSPQFHRLMTDLDNAWKELAASLYMLYRHSNWFLAVEIDPSLEKIHNDLIVAVLTADLYRREMNLLAGLSVPKKPYGGRPDTEFRWIPRLMYYKNIPEITGQIASPPDMFFFVRVNLGYSIGDKETQTWLNRHKNELTEHFRIFFSGVNRETFHPPNTREPGEAIQRNVFMKAEEMHVINTSMLQHIPLGKNKVYGLRDISFIQINFLENP